MAGVSHQLVGRHAELERLHTALTSAADGAGSAVILSGEPGIGKTALAEATAITASTMDVLVTRSRGLRSTGEVPFAGLHQALLPMLGSIESLPERQRAALNAVLGLGDVDLPTDRLILGLATLGLLEEASQRQPVLVIIDDLQWFDPSSADVITFVASRLEHTSVLLVATARTSPSLNVAEAAFDLAIHVPPLTNAASSDLITQHAPNLDNTLRRRVLGASFGNPLALTEMAKAPPISPAMTHPWGGTTPALEQAFLSEVAGLSGQSQRALLLLAAGEDASVSEILETAERLGLSPDAFTDAERVGLVRQRDGRFIFRHPLIASSIYDTADTSSRLEAHRALAAVVRDDARRVHHRAASTIGWDEDVAAELAASAHTAFLQGGKLEASNAWLRAAEITPEGKKQAARVVLAAESARQAGATTTAAELLDNARARLASADSETKHLFARAEWVLSMTGTYRGRTTAEMLSLAEVAPSESERSEILVWAASKSYVQQEPEPARSAIARAIEHHITTGGGDVLDEVALALVEREHHFQSSVIDRYLQRARASDGLVINALAFAAEEAGDFAAADRCWTAGIRLFHEAGRVSDEVTAFCGRSAPRIFAGQLSAGIADAEQSLRLSNELELTVVAAMALSDLALGYARQGAFDKAEQALARVKETQLDSVVARIGSTAAWAEALIRTAERRFDEALLAFERTQVNSAIALWAQADIIEVANATGDFRLLDAWIAEAEAAAEQLQSPRFSALIERVKGTRSVADETSIAHFERSLEYGAVLAGVELESGRTHLALGQRLRRQRRLLEAREHLTRAAQIFEAVGARALAQDALTDLRAAGGAHNDSSQDDPLVGQLSAQELLVARLAATGRTNREIADEVYLSHRTVGAYLSQAFAKLGVSRRSQLASKLGPEAAGRMIS